MLPYRTFSSETNEECFGWWIGADYQTAQIEKVSQTQNETDTNQSLLDVTSSTFFGDDSSACLQCSEEEAEHIELTSFDRLDSGFDEGNQRGFSYTPERLVKHEEFKILTPSPRFFPILDDCQCQTDYNDHKTGSFDPKIIGVDSRSCSVELMKNTGQCPATYSSGCCNVNYGDGELILLPSIDAEDSKDISHSTSLQLPFSYVNDHFIPNFEKYVGACCYSNSPKRNECWSNEVDTLQQDLADDTSGVSSTDVGSRTQDNDWSFTPSNTENDENLSTKLLTRRSSDESNYVSLEYASVSQAEQREKAVDMNEVLTILMKLENNLNDEQTLINERFRAVQSSHKSLNKLASAKEPDVKCLTSQTKNPKNIKTELEDQRDKIERLQSSSKELFEEIRILRHDFSKDEGKMNNLSKDIYEFKNEVHELRYFDDLLCLLKGELEGISKRSWPFAIRHKKYGIEEINLVV